MPLLSYQKLAVSQIKKHKKGTIFIPTGGGKTYVFMTDAKNRIQESDSPLTIVVVAPRILLSEQLASEFQKFLKDEEISITHVHSGHKNGTTKPHVIATYDAAIKALNKHHIIFTTYKSLERVNESGIPMNVVYFDEAHNAVKPATQVGVAHTSQVSDNTYFFTATPKIAMNQTNIYGSNIVSVSATELISAGTILSPKVETYEFNEIRTKENAPLVDASNVIGILSEFEEENPKVLVAAPSTKIIWESLSQTALLNDLNAMGYTVMHITSKHGAYIDRKKVSRQVFFNKLTEYGNDPTKKIIVFHYSILSEGINVPGLTHCIMLRNLPTVEMLQTIGRVIRVSKEDRDAIEKRKIQPGQFEFYKKSEGKIIIPISKGYGANIQRNIQNLVDAVFVQGQTVVS